MLWFLPFSGVASWEDDSDPDSVAAFSLLLSVLPSFDFGGLYHKKIKWDKQEESIHSLILALQNKTSDDLPAGDTTVDKPHTRRIPMTLFSH